MLFASGKIKHEAYGQLKNQSEERERERERYRILLASLHIENIQGVSGITPVGSLIAIQYYLSHVLSGTIVRHRNSENKIDYCEHI